MEQYTVIIEVGSLSKPNEDFFSQKISSFESRVENLLCFENVYFNFIEDITLDRGTKVPMLIKMRFLDGSKELEDSIKDSMEVIVNSIFEREALVIPF